MSEPIADFPVPSGVPFLARQTMPTEVIPALEKRPAQFERYEDFVSEAADAARDATKNGRGTFIVGVKERQVVAVNLLAERENSMAFMHRALQIPAVAAQLDGGYESFLASITGSRHKEKFDLVASALAREREWSVPLRSRRILDVNNFLELNTPIPAFSEAEYSAVFKWSTTTSSSSPDAGSTAHSEPGDAHNCPPQSSSPMATESERPVSVCAEGPRPTVPIEMPHPSTLNTVRLPSECATRNYAAIICSDPRQFRGLTHNRYTAEVRQWAVPREIDAGRLAEVWQADATNRFPPPLRAEAANVATGAVDDKQPALRQELHEGLRKIAAGLGNRVDPRPALAELYRRVLVLGAREDSPEALFIANCANDHNMLLNMLSAGLANVFPFGYPHATPPQVPWEGAGLIPEEDTAAAPDRPVEVAIRQGLVPPSINADALSARWQERARREVPAIAESDPGVLLDDRLVRDHFHDAVFAVAKRLETGFDPRELLSDFYNQIVSLSATPDHVECRALARMKVEYEQLLHDARCAEQQAS